MTSPIQNYALTTGWDIGIEWVNNTYERRHQA